jgi:hypothetical protein
MCAELSGAGVPPGELLTALELALPYVESVAARQPTTYANTERQRKAASDAKMIRAAIVAAKGGE